MPGPATLARAAGAALVSLLLAPPGAAAENVLPNGSFDSTVAPWQLDSFSAGFASAGWSPEDVDGSPASGSLNVANTGAEAVNFASVRVCLPAEAGKEYTFGFSSLVPSGQTPSGDVASSLTLFPNDDCKFPNVGGTNGPRMRLVGSWETTVVGPITAPAETRSIQLSMGVRKTEALPGAVNAYFDAAYLTVGSGPPPDSEPVPDPDPAGWFADPAFPGFRFNVLITAGGSSRLGTPEPTCLPETVCVSGALPGRVEVFLRIVGPRPNGHLWPTLFKASTSRFDVWIEQLSTGAVKHYVLEGAEPGSSELPGLFDREGFLP